MQKCSLRSSGSLEQLVETLQEKKQQWDYYCDHIDALPNADKPDVVRLYDLLIQAALFSNIGISRDELIKNMELSDNTLRSRLKLIPESLLCENRQKGRKYYLLDLEKGLCEKISLKTKTVIKTILPERR